MVIADIEIYLSTTPLEYIPFVGVAVNPTKVAAPDVLVPVLGIEEPLLIVCLKS